VSQKNALCEHFILLTILLFLQQNEQESLLKAETELMDRTAENKKLCDEIDQSEWVIY
jgi:hypothetical protein